MEKKKYNCRVAEYRHAVGLSQSQLAALCGCSAKLIAALEQGDRDINATGAMTVYKMSRALKCKLTDLLVF